MSNKLNYVRLSDRDTARLSVMLCADSAEHSLRNEQLPYALLRLCVLENVLTRHREELSDVIYDFEELIELFDTYRNDPETAIRDSLCEALDDLAVGIEEKIGHNKEQPTFPYHF